MDIFWKTLIEEERKKDYFKLLSNQLLNEEKRGVVIYPHKKDIFNAFKLTPYNDVKVVIQGQDPYHGKNQADGLAFSTIDIKRPPSLQNIFKEISDDIYGGLSESEYNKKFTSNNLESWAKQGVLLLNTALTVQAGKPSSHSDIGWLKFTTEVIKTLNKRNNIVYMLWGKHAQYFEKFITNDNSLILKTSHPSPFSVRNGFSGCKHFTKASSYLRSKGIKEIEW